MPIQFWIIVFSAVPLGLLFGWWSDRLIALDRQLTQRPPLSAGMKWPRRLMMTGLYVTLCGGLFLVVSAGGQATPEVQPSPWGLGLRRYYHQMLIGLILVATVVDWDGYIIPDQITFPGMLAGLCGAFLGGEMQLIHLWVDWMPPCRKSKALTFQTGLTPIGTGTAWHGASPAWRSAPG